MDMKSDNAQWNVAADGFAAIGAGPRLQVLRLLVRSEPEGLTVSEIRDRTGIAASTLAHHLRVLAEAGVVTQTRHGRSIRTRADIGRLQALADFLIAECCADTEGGSRS